MEMPCATRNKRKAIITLSDDTQRGSRHDCPMMQFSLDLSEFRDLAQPLEQIEPLFADV